MRKAIRWMAQLGIGGAILAGIAYALRPDPIPVDIAIATIGAMRQTVQEEGKTRIRERYVVSSPLTGRIRRITLDPGDRVRTEQTVLAVLEPTDPALLDPRALAEAEARTRAAEAAVRQADVNLERLRLTYEHAEKELGRVAEAAEKGAVTERELDLARTEERTIGEELRAARFAGEIARYELEVARSAMLFAKGETPNHDPGRMELRSPIDGSVLRVLQESVAVVRAGTPLLEVGDPQDLEIVIDVLSTDAVRVRPGDRVIVEHWGGDAQLEGVVRLVEPSAFTKISSLGIEEQRVNVIADFVTPPQDRAALADGFRIEAVIIVWESEATLQIPISAVFRNGDRWAVFAIEDGAAALREIEIGRQNGRTAEVFSGLAEGALVALHPSDRLHPGARVSVRSKP